MFRKNDFDLITVALVSIPMLLICISVIGAEKSVSDMQQSTKISQVNSENNDTEKITMDYILIPLTRLIGMADQIVTGSVEDIGDSAFNFHVDEYLLHPQASTSINVIKYIPGEIFAPRAQPYARGQRFILFLLRPEQVNADHAWKIIGNAGEGEMPVEDEYVYFSAYDLKGLEYKPREVHGRVRNLQRYNLDDFRDAVKTYRTCFSWKLVERIKNNKKRTRWVASKTCHAEAIKNHQAKSWLHDYLAQETIKKLPVKQ